MPRMNGSKAWAMKTVLVLWLSAFLSGVQGLIGTAAAQSPREDLTEAESLYFDLGRVDDALRIVERILADPAAPDAVAHGASVLEGRIQTKLDRPDLATAAFRRAFCLDRGWNPTPADFSEREMSLIGGARATLDCDRAEGGKSITKKWWFWAAAGGTVAGLALALGGGGGGGGNGGEPLPEFPAPPGSARPR